MNEQFLYWRTLLLLVVMVVLDYELFNLSPNVFTFNLKWNQLLPKSEKSWNIEGCGCVRDGFQTHFLKLSWGKWSPKRDEWRKPTNQLHHYRKRHGHGVEEKKMLVVSIHRISTVCHSQMSRRTRLQMTERAAEGHKEVFIRRRRAVMLETVPWGGGEKGEAGNFAASVPLILSLPDMCASIDTCRGHADGAVSAPLCNFPTHSLLCLLAMDAR